MFEEITRRAEPPRTEKQVVAPGKSHAAPV